MSSVFDIPHPHIVISGTIGSGKSTLARALGKAMFLPVHYEPVEANPYLNLFYTDQAKYAFQMQIFLLNARYVQQQQITWQGLGAVQDRSIFEDSVFADMLHEAGVLNDLDYATYTSIQQTMLRPLPRPTMIVYLDLTPEQAMANIRARGRQCENSITIEYLTALRAAYEKFLVKISKTVPVIRVDNSKFPSVNSIVYEIQRCYISACNIHTALIDTVPLTPPLRDSRAPDTEQLNKSGRYETSAVVGSCPTNSWMSRAAEK